MAQYTITATSAKKEQTVSNTDTKRYPSPAEFGNDELANSQAVKYAKDLNAQDYNETWDWVGHATAV
jgi:hypothetical protein